MEQTEIIKMSEKQMEIIVNVVLLLNELGLDSKKITESEPLKLFIMRDAK